MMQDARECESGKNSVQQEEDFFKSKFILNLREKTIKVLHLEHSIL
jgi:hypothetical protein